MMRIGLDTNALYVTRAGTARYVEGLMRGIRQAAVADLELVPFAWEVENMDYHQPQRALRTAYRELVWAPLRAPHLLKKNGVRLFHSPAIPLLRPPRGIKEVVTLLDLAMLRYPERFRRWHRFATRRHLKDLHLADRIICISRFTADEAMALLQIPASKIVVIHCGCDFHAGEPAPPEATPGFPVPAEFLLFVGSLEPGKNLALLKDVYALARAARRALPPLLIVGARWEGVGHEGAPPEDWHYLGRQPDGVLIHLYRRALALVFPSKYEGFGLPVAEAMALGCPVVCSPVTSLPEVGGEAAYFVPLAAAAYLDALERVSREAGLRRELAGKGLVQAAKFSWKKCAGEVIATYGSVLEN